MDNRLSEFYTQKELKNILKSLDLPVTGNKKILVHRISENEKEHMKTEQKTRKISHKEKQIQKEQKESKKESEEKEESKKESEEKEESNEEKQEKEESNEEKHEKQKIIVIKKFISKQE